MKNKYDNTDNVKNLAAGLIIVLLTLGVLYCSYYLDISTPVKSMLWIGWLVFSLTLGFFTTQGKQLIDFAKESKIELQKVVWPTRQETVQTTSIVMVMVTIAGIVLWGIDAGMMWIIGKITHLG